jgi:WD40 repeat protein
LLTGIGSTPATLVGKPSPARATPAAPYCLAAGSLRLGSRGEAIRWALASTISWVTSVAFAPDGRTLATASDDGTAILWDLGDLRHIRDNPVANACSITGRGFNPEEWAAYVPSLDYEDSCAT